MCLHWPESVICGGLHYFLEVFMNKTGNGAEDNRNHVSKGWLEYCRLTQKLSINVPFLSQKGMWYLQQLSSSKQRDYMEVFLFLP